MSNYEVSFGTNQQVVLNTLRNAGLRDIVIAGIMSNIETESHFSTAWQGDQGSVGICQWRGTRRDNLAAFAQKRGAFATDINIQAAFIVEEFSGNDYRILNPEIYNALQNGVSVKRSADIFTATYEIPLSYSSWQEVEQSGNDISRFSQEANTYDNKYYLDTPLRRGYAEAYLEQIVRH